MNRLFSGMQRGIIRQIGTRVVVDILAIIDGSALPHATRRKFSMIPVDVLKRQESTMDVHSGVGIVACMCVALATPALSGPQLSPVSAENSSHAEGAVSGLHDFDFLVGHWRVHHRKLKERLVNNHEWIEFEGTLASQPLMGGYANVDDDVFEVPGGTYRGVAPRSSASRSGCDSSGRKSPLRPVTGSRRSHPMVVRPGRRIGSRI